MVSKKPVPEEDHMLYGSTFVKPLDEANPCRQKADRGGSWECGAMGTWGRVKAKGDWSVSLG